jgi:hypothetical protein
MGDRGLKFLQGMRDRFGYQGGKLRKLWLTGDGDIAKFRVLTEGDAMFSHVFHEVKVASTRKDFTKDVLCTRRLDDELNFIDPPEVCPQCAAGLRPDASDDTRKSAYVKPKAVLWVYVYAIAHRHPAPDGSWVRGTRGLMEVYIENVSELRLWLLRNRMIDAVVNRYYENGSLLDRDWELERMGVTGQGPVQYTFVGKDQGAPSAECLEAMKELRPLEEVVLEEFGDRKPGAPEVSTPPTGQGTGSAGTAELPFETTTF